MSFFEQSKNNKIDGQSELVSKTRQFFAELKETNLQAKERKEIYDPHFEEIDPNTITPEEAKLYEDLNNMKSVDDYSSFSQALNMERNKIPPEQYREGDLRGLPKDPHMNFLAYLSNKAISKYSEILRSKEKKEF